MRAARPATVGLRKVLEDGLSRLLHWRMHFIRQSCVVREVQGAREEIIRHMPRVGASQNVVVVEVLGFLRGVLMRSW
jgi:hypothetical protein